MVDMSWSSVEDSSVLVSMQVRDPSAEEKELACR